MSEDAVCVAARVVNRFIQFDRATGGFPMAGRLTPQGWAEVLHVSPETIRRWVTLYDVRHKQFGAEMVIDAEDLWEAVPYQKPSESPRKPRGGSRRKKAS